MVDYGFRSDQSSAINSSYDQKNIQTRNSRKESPIMIGEVYKYKMLAKFQFL